MAAMAQREQRGASAQGSADRRRKRRRRGRYRTHFVLIVLFLLGLGAILSFTVFWRIEAVRVVGTDKYDPDLIAEDSGILIGDNLLRIDKEDVAARIIAKYPYVASVEVSRRLPPAVEIAITQSVPDAAVRNGDEVVLFTGDGKVLERGKILIPESVPLIIGIEVDGPAPVEGENGEMVIPEGAPIVRTEPGSPLPETQNEKLGMLKNLLAAMEETGFTSITNVDLSDRLNIQIVYENRILLKLGVEADLALKLETIRLILENEIGPEEEGTLDVSEASKWAIFSPEFGEDQRLEPALGAIGLEDGYVYSEESVLNSGQAGSEDTEEVDEGVSDPVGARDILTDSVDNTANGG